ncbi:MAG: hypothetical protein ABIH46_05690 [Chloroflexota bacterium]
MPFWISWVNPRTQKRERIYNFFSPETPPGRLAIDIAKRCLTRRFGIPQESIPGFRVEKAEGGVPWQAPSG